MPGKRVGRQALASRNGHPSVKERAASGKAARAKVPRRSNGMWQPSSDRPDPIGLLEEQAATRVAELVPIRYGRMLTSPSAFYRGAALIMASDLADTANSGIRVQLCGDAHLSNFGVFGTPERNFVFDINDFDETHPGPWEWDLKRLAASFAVVGREQGCSAKQRTGVVTAIVREYRTAMRDFASSGNLEVWYAQLGVDRLLAALRNELGPRRTAETASALAKARTKDSLRALAKLTHVVDGERRIVSDPPLIVPIEELVAGPDSEELERFYRALFRGYLRTLTPELRLLLDDYDLVHFARKVVGVGSVGTDTWILLLLGRDDRDPLMLQAKEAGPSVLERFLGRSAYDNGGRRVVAGQRLMQAASDVCLGWDRIEQSIAGGRRDYYVRQLYDWKGTAEIEQMRPKDMASYGRLCAWTLARAHARSGDRIAIASYVGNGDSLDGAIARFAEAYADQNELDYRAFREAVAAGRIDAKTGL